MSSLCAESTPCSQPLAWRRFAVVTLVFLLFCLAWDAAGQDLAWARRLGTAQGFPLRDNWWLSAVFHNGARRALWGAALVLVVFWPLGLRRLSRSERAWLLLAVALSLLTVSAIKTMSPSSCPWDLAMFGGHAPYVSHWQWGVVSGGGGHCFPGGHATGGFVFMAVYFWLYPYSRRAARGWLLAAASLGLFLGLVQQLRGAHFMSHTLWTAWLCWTVAGLVHALMRRLQRAPAGSLPQAMA